MQPGFEEALSNAFNPLGVYLNFWQPKLAAGASRAMAVSLVNDEYEPAQGKLVLSVVAGDKALVRREMDVEVAPLGQQTCIYEPAHPLRERPL